MTRIAYSPYELKPRSGAPARRGALIRVSREEGSFGYADCHPWPELGDRALDLQLHSIGPEGWPGSQTDALLLTACTDEWLRKNKLSAFTGARVPPSHASLPHALNSEGQPSDSTLDELAAKRFHEIKVKGGSAPEPEIEKLTVLRPRLIERNLKLRLDLNARLTPPEALHYLEAIGAGPDWIDWVEDPTEFYPLDWQQIKKRFGIRIAIDQRLTSVPEWLKGAVDVLVIKPAIQDSDRLISLAGRNGYSICVTSYLGHPLGQMIAAAAIPKDCKAKIETGGLLTHEVYEENEFSRLIQTDGPRLIPPDGPGYGFGEQLAALDWQELATWES